MTEYHTCMFRGPEEGNTRSCCTTLLSFMKPLPGCVPATRGAAERSQGTSVGNQSGRGQGCLFLHGGGTRISWGLLCCIRGRPQRSCKEVPWRLEISRGLRRAQRTAEFGSSVGVWRATTSSDDFIRAMEENRGQRSPSSSSALPESNLNCPRRDLEIAKGLDHPFDGENQPERQAPRLSW